MPRYKDYSYEQSKLLPVAFDRQILPGTFEYTLNHLIDHEVDLAAFDEPYQNDDTGAPAYDPRILLKIVLFAYSRGIFTSRRIEQACRENVVFMALSADTCPHWTTIADFISTRHEAIAVLFREVLLVCDTLGLLGKELFAIDGCKLSSNAAKEWSGTHADLQKKHQKLEQAIRVMLDRHREEDARGGEAPGRARDAQYLDTVRRQVSKIKQFLATQPENVGPKGTIRQSNITDPESAKMKTSHGVVQGYTGVAAVDAKHQVIVHAEAHGEGQEHGLLRPTVEAVRETVRSISDDDNIFTTATLTADAGYHTEANMQYVCEEGIDAYIADRAMRQRDPRFADADRHKVRHREERRQQARRKTDGRTPLFTPADFRHDPAQQTCVCPAGRRLYKNGSHITIRGFTGVKFRGAKSVCGPCGLRAQCLKRPDTTPVRQVVFFSGRSPRAPETFTAKMQRKIDSVVGKLIYRQRLATAEPPFAHLRHAKGLHRFTVRGKMKVTTQWRLYCLVHNLFKVHQFGPGFA
jgi:transposase